MFHCAVGRSVDHVGFIRALELSGFFILTKRGRERLVRLMADELGEIAEIAIGSERKVTKRKLKRLQVSRSFWFILLVKVMCLFFHLQRIWLVRFDTKSTANPILSHNSKRPPFSLRTFSWLSSHGTAELLEVKVIYLMLGIDLSCKHCLLIRALY